MYSSATDATIRPGRVDRDMTISPHPRLLGQRVLQENNAHLNAVLRAEVSGSDAQLCAHLFPF